MITSLLLITALFAEPQYIDSARLVSFSTKQGGTPVVTTARMDWAMGPSSGDALLYFVKKGGTRKD